MKPSWATTKLTPFDGAAARGKTSREPAIRVAISPRKPGISAPEAAGRVAKAVVPFSEVGAERAELVAARADVPGFGDEPRPAQERILRQRLEEWRVGVETVRSAAERGRKIETEAVEPAVTHPSPQRVDRHPDDNGPVEREAIAATRIVDVGRRIPGIEAEPRCVVEPAERQGRPELVTFAIVVEDDVEDRFDSRGMQRVGRRPHLGPAAGRETRVGYAEHHRIVAPRVGEAERRQVPLVDESVGGHDFDRGHAQAGDVGDRSRMRQSCEGRARALWNCQVQTREAAQIEFVDDERFLSDALPPGVACRRRPRDRFRRVRAAVVAERKHRAMQPEWPVERPCVRVGQQFGSVELGPARRIVRALDPEAIARAGSETWRKPAEDAVRVARHRGAEHFAVAVVEAERRAFGIGQVERRLQAMGRDGDAETPCIVHAAAPATER